MSKRTYFTKKDMISFSEYIVSDERRLKKQIECRDKINAGTINPMSWSQAERIIKPQDLEDWKLKQ
jgi:hypothetical protein